MIVKCKNISELWISSHGDESFFELPMARTLEKQGHVKIVGDREGRPFGKSAILVSDTEYLYREGFEKDKNLTKVAWIQDYRKDGGAELSNFFLVKIGSQCGFDIVGITPDNNNLDLINQADVLIVNNIFEFGESQFQRLLKLIYESKKPIIKYEHDHREIERRNIGSRLYFESALNFFISPSHLERHEKVFPGISDRSICLPLAIDINRWILPPDSNRMRNSIIIPSHWKCRENAAAFIASHPEYSFTVIGYSDYGRDNIESIPEVKIEDMPRLYNQHEYMFHCPEKVGGGERVLFEAVLCGCKVISNENASHCSWSTKWNWEDERILRERLKFAPYMFWREIHKVVNNAK